MTMSASEALNVFGRAWHANAEAALRRLVFIEGDGAPAAVTPEFVGQAYFDRVAKQFYIATSLTVGSFKAAGDSPNPVIVGTTLRGYQLSTTGLGGGTLQWQDRTSPGGAWNNVALPNPFTIGNGTAPAGGPGRGYRAVITKGAATFISAEVGPTGVTDSVPNSTFMTSGQRIASLNTVPGAWQRGVDFFNSIRNYLSQIGSATRMEWFVGAGVFAPNGNVACFMHTRLNRYTDDPAQTGYSSGVAHSELSTQPIAWSITPDAGSTPNRSMLVEYFPTDDANNCAQATAGVGGNRLQEIGVLPVVDDDARAYFIAAPVIAYPDYVDEAGLSWLVRSKPGPSIVKTGGRYIVAFPPPGADRLVGNRRMDRFTNWLISQDATKGAYFMTGIASGLEIIAKAAGGRGAMEGIYLPDDVAYPWSGVAAAAYTFDTDVAAYFARYANLQGMEVRKAVDAFIVGMKADGLYALLDTIHLPRVGGVVDMRREFKSASRDIVDRAGAASYVAKQGLTYAGAGYGGTQFNPATAAGQFQQNSAFLFMFIESDAGAVAASHFGNSTARMGRNTANNSVSSQLNNAGAQFGGLMVAGAQGYSLRRVAGSSPAGTGGAAGYQVKRTGTTTAIYDATAASSALSSEEIEVGRAASGAVYSSAVFSVLAAGAGLTNTQADAFHARVNTLRAALDTAGI